MNITQLQKRDKPVFMDETEIGQALTSMEENSLLRTPKCSVLDALNESRDVTFKEKHMEYLQKHPKVNPQHYLANLRAMIKIRP